MLQFLRKQKTGISIANILVFALVIGIIVFINNNAVNVSEPDTHIIDPAVYATISGFIADHKEQINGGDVIKIKSGIYKEQLDLTNCVSGETGNYVTFEAMGDGPVIIDGEGTRKHGIHIHDAKYIKLKGLTITGSYDSGVWIDATDDSGIAEYTHHIILDAMTIKNTVTGEGVHIKGPVYYPTPSSAPEAPTPTPPVYDIQITNSTIKKTNHSAICGVGYIRDILVDNNTIYDIGRYSEDQFWKRIGHGNGMSFMFGEDGNSLTTHSVPKFITISNNEIHNVMYQGIHIYNADHLLIKNNYIHHAGVTGIQIEDGAENFVIEDNEVEWNEQRKLDETGIWVSCSKNGVVRRNTIRHQSYSLWITNMENLGVHHNVIARTDQNPIPVSDVKNWMYPLYEFEHVGILIETRYKTYPYNSNVILKKNDNVRIVNNTIYRTGLQTGTYNNGIHIIMNWETQLLNVHIINNIIANTINGYEIKVAKHQSDETIQVQSFMVDYNNYYNTYSPFKAKIYDTIYNFESWTNKPGFALDINSKVDINPLFVNEAANDFRLTSNSALMDAGRELTRTRSASSPYTQTNTNRIPVEDAGYFYNLTYNEKIAGYNSHKAEGDKIMIEGVSGVHEVEVVDFDNNVIYLKAPIRSFDSDKKVYFEYTGSGPGIGAEDFPEINNTL